MEAGEKRGERKGERRKEKKKAGRKEAVGTNSTSWLTDQTEQVKKTVWQWEKSSTVQWSRTGPKQLVNFGLVPASDTKVLWET